jgi:hypothetical protein
VSLRRYLIERTVGFVAVLWLALLLEFVNVIGAVLMPEWRTE